MNDVKFAAQQLSKKEMNQLKGGKNFNCSCKDGAAYPSYSPNWSKDYERTGDIAPDVMRRCVYGGTCEPGPANWLPGLN